MKLNQIKISFFNKAFDTNSFKALGDGQWWSVAGGNDQWWEVASGVGWLRSLVGRSGRLWTVKRGGGR